MSYFGNKFVSLKICAAAVFAFGFATVPEHTWAVDAQSEDNLPGKVIQSWLANSFGKASPNPFFSPNRIKRRRQKSRPSMGL